MTFWRGVLAWRDIIIIVIIISTELLALCDRCLGWGWVWQAGLVAGLREGQAFGVLLLGLGSAAPAPRFLGTQPPHVAQALKKQNDTCCVLAMKTAMPLVLFQLRLNFPDFILNKDHPFATI